MLFQSKCKKNCLLFEKFIHAVQNVYFWYKINLFKCLFFLANAFHVQFH